MEVFYSKLTGVAENSFPRVVMKHSHPILIAALRGDLEIFKWLRYNGMKWHPSTYTVAKKSFHDDIAELAVKNGCPKDEYTSGICFSFSTVLIIITQNILSRFFLNYRKNYL